MSDKSRMDRDIWLAGVDGCAGGWITVFVRPSGEDMKISVYERFAELAAAPENPAIVAIVAIDMPIGLPDRTGPGGRDVENAVRPLLGQRQSSVFSVPSRSAVYAKDYDEAREIALATSNPPRSVARQLFSIAPRIREVDAALRADSSLPRRVFEVHPELAFWRLNGERPLGEPKKVKSKCFEPGLALRRKLLIAAGLPVVAVEGRPPEGAGADDLLDALACAAIARRIHAGHAQPFPDRPPRDAYGLPMAIWA